MMGNQVRLAQIVRVLNITLCVMGIAYFGSSLRLANFPTSFLNVGWHLVTQALIVFPQILFLLAMFVVELRRTGGVGQRVISLVVIVALLVLGHFWSLGVIGAIES
jgi:hypothetical protein